MEKQVNFAIHGHRADVGEYTIYRLLPNRFVDAVGPFVFLDHAASIVHEPDEPLKNVVGSGAHPHRRIATLTYVLSGEADHFGSAGHHAKVSSGGAQWMKAGTDIIHDESINPDAQINDYTTQFWVNLPAQNKTEQPQYVPVQVSEVPKMELVNNSGWLKVVSGEYRSMKLKILSCLKQFIYHIHLNPGKEFVLMFTNVRGKFDSYTAKISTVGFDFTALRTEVKIESASINTNDKQRDEHLRSADFFDIDNFKEITFVSISYEKTKKMEIIIFSEI